jgi:hypothetical protein
MPHLPDHVTHDPQLIAAYAAGDATGPALDEATELVAACTGCAELHRDLRAISTALPELPAPVRPRDFRLTPEQAASLRPAGWRAVLAAFAAPRFRLAAPLGTGLAVAGLAGLLLASPGGLLPQPSGEATSASAPAVAGAPVQADQASGAGAAAVGAAPVDGAGTDPERAFLGADVAKASAAASAGLAPLPQPGAYAPDASAPAASAMPDTLNAMGTAPTAAGDGSGRTSNLAAPSAGASTPAYQRAPDAASREPAPPGLTARGPEAALAPAGESPVIPVVATVLLVVGVTLVVLRLVARRLA